MKTIFICTCGHCVLILTLITLTLLLINSALSLADSAADAQYSNQLTDPYKKAPRFEEDANQYSAVISSLSGTAASNPSIDSFNPYPPSGSEKSNDDDQLNNWDTSYDTGYVNNANGQQQAGPVPAGVPPEDGGGGVVGGGGGGGKESKDNGATKPNGVPKAELPLTKRYMACSRDFGNITVKNKTAGDNGFKIKITGNSEKYTPGELYTSKWLLELAFCIGISLLLVVTFVSGF